MLGLWILGCCGDVYGCIRLWSCLFSFWFVLVCWRVVLVIVGSILLCGIRFWYRCCYCLFVGGWMRVLYLGFVWLLVWLSFLLCCYCLSVVLVVGLFVVYVSRFGVVVGWFVWCFYFYVFCWLLVFGCRCFWLCISRSNGFWLWLVVRWCFSIIVGLGCWLYGLLVFVLLVGGYGCVDVVVWCFLVIGKRLILRLVRCFDWLVVLWFVVVVGW